MVRKIRRENKTEALAEDVSAYFTQAPWKPGKLREIGVIEQMYGYYTAE